MKTDIGFLHASPAAIAPLMKYYSQNAPELRITNLLDDGLLRFFAAKDFDRAGLRLHDMIATCRSTYDCKLAMITCTAVPRATIDALSREAGLRVLKIDEPMARRAVDSGSRIGVAVTFEPTVEPTCNLLRQAAFDAGREVEIVTEIMPAAYKAMLGGSSAEHDRILLEGIAKLGDRRVDVIVLAQVSMARVLDDVSRRATVPVLTSMDTSLDAIRGLIGTRP